MIGLILNSGIGSRMGGLTSSRPKCMIEILDGVPLVDHQIDTLRRVGVTRFIMTTGYMYQVLEEHLSNRFGSDLTISFVNNPAYATTNYIYSMYLALDQLKDDVVIAHGDLYFERETVQEMFSTPQSCVVVDSAVPLPPKDFKAQIDRNRVARIATYLAGPDCVACQPLYHLTRHDWAIWSDAIEEFCREGKTSVYAEEALNTVLTDIRLDPFDVRGAPCMEIDTEDDLEQLRTSIVKGGMQA